MKNSIKNLLLIIVCIVLCFMLGRSLYQVASSNKRMAMLKSQISSNKLDAVLNLVATKYVEEVDTKEIIEKLIPDVLKELDPHSVYIPAKEMEKTMEEMEGSFSGVGIQFNIREDTIRVISVINGGPAEQAGMRAGDCIVSVDDSVFVGDKINNDLVLKTLRGPKHSKVKVGIARRGTEEILPFTLVRDDIPLTSVDASYKIGENIAYIKVGNFSRTTYDEFLNKMVKLKQVDHCDRLILDLRSNPGGLMGAALAILNEFLPKNRLMLYVEGKSYPREESYSDGRGSFEDMPVVILMDEWSAS
ncbi:MAG: PDZ domain-containing protein, partial [Bacteroidales bacterium]|nr:PDZ domain-containing protein [Bacteroidales bacterium]